MNLIENEAIIITLLFIYLNKTLFCHNQKLSLYLRERIYKDLELDDCWLLWRLDQTHVSVIRGMKFDQLPSDV
jgi:hypothetical protein